MCIYTRVLSLQYNIAPYQKQPKSRPCRSRSLSDIIYARNLSYSNGDGPINLHLCFVRCWKDTSIGFVLCYAHVVRFLNVCMYLNFKEKNPVVYTTTKYSMLSVITRYVLKNGDRVFLRTPISVILAHRSVIRKTTD